MATLTLAFSLEGKLGYRLSQEPLGPVLSDMIGQIPLGALFRILQGHSLYVREIRLASPRTLRAETPVFPSSLLFTPHRWGHKGDLCPGTQAGP